MENNESNKYVYLDFNGKLPSDVFQNQVFLRIANLRKTNPLVQINDSLFKGSYDQSIGTNLFFEETDDNLRTSSAFEKQPPINLKYSHKSTKLLNLQQVKIPQAKAKIPNEIRNINYNLNFDYNTLLEKLENGTLQLQDICSNEVTQKVEVEEQLEETCMDTVTGEPESEPEPENKLEKSLDDILPSKILEAEYEQLNTLARRPVRRAASPELVAECDKEFEEAYEYHNIERQILQLRDGFTSEVLHVNEDTLSDCIDIDRCVLFGLIPPSSDFPRVLSNQEKETLLTLENFDNLSLAGRYYVLQNIVKDLEEYVKTIDAVKLETRDEYGRTPVKTLKIYKKLTDTVRNRLQEIKWNLENESDKNASGESEDTNAETEESVT